MDRLLLEMLWKEKQNRNMRNKKSIIETLLVATVVFGIVFHVVPFILKYFNTKSNTIPQAFKDSEIEAKRKNELIQQELNKNIEKKIRLDKKCKYGYFFVRIFLVSCWLGTMVSLYLFDLIKTLEDFLNFSELCLVIVVSFNFLRFGKLSNLNDFVKLIKLRTENWVYRNDLDLEEQITSTEQQLSLNLKN